jgi:hypothetical protein
MAPLDHKAHVAHKEFLALLVQLEPPVLEQLALLVQLVPLALLEPLGLLAHRALLELQLLLLDQCQM